MATGKSTFVLVSLFRGPSLQQPVVFLSVVLLVSK